MNFQKTFMDIETIKQEIEKLINKYNKVIEEKRVSQYNEEMTKKDFVLPLFRALGWNTEDSNEVTAEEKISKKRVDYGFRINGISKFFLEAKSLKEDLNKPESIEQAINYAWLKRCTWAVLTDFESVKIFNAEWKTSNPLQSHLKTILCQEFLDRFNELWLLSKESFEQGLIDKEAEKWGKKTKKITVDKQLLADFTGFRELLSKNITKLNQSKNLTEEDLDEAVQRILDRLIFIRNCEDGELEAYTLISSFREWESSGRGQLIKSLREVFAYFDKQYNSKIFTNHLCDNLDIDNEVLHEIIEGLYYTKDKSVSYDFSAIEADVLGNIYEQYLGHILKKSEKRAKLTEDHAHRKEQGIYYTPTYIVDYIVRNTLGELLKDKKVNAEEIRVLDPACGSGSFLIKTFDVLNEYYSKHDKDYLQTQIDFKTGLPFTTKVKILQNNIFGVDLDKQAVEIAQLNLLLKIAEKGHRLPLLQQNIKCGNSLINDSAIAGDKAFKWEEQFKDIMNEDGFDVVIGNPPYIKARDTKDPISRKWMEESGKFETLYKMWDIYIAFVEKGIKLLKPNGCFTMIIPDTIGEADYTSKLVELIINKYSLYQIDFFPDIEVFSGVGVKNKIIFIKNTRKINKCRRILHEKELDNIKDIEVMNNRIPSVFRLTLSKINLNFKQTIPLGNICYVSYGARFNSEKNDKIKFKKEDLVSYEKDRIHNKLYAEGKFIGKYKINKKSYVEWDTERCPKRLVRPTFPELYPPNKLLMSRIKRVTAYSDEGHVCDNTIIVGVPYYELRNVNNKGIDKYIKNIKIDRKTVEIISIKFDIKYILSILNSKLIKYFLNINSRSKLSIYPDDWKKIPIKEIDLNEQQLLVKSADKMLFLNKRLNEIGDKKTDERAKIEEEIKKTDSEIDKLVYKIYDITEDEKKIIEESLK